MLLDKKTKWKKLLLITIAILMAVMLAFATACGSNEDNTNNSDDEKDNTKVVATDYQELTNGDFEYGITSSTTYPYTSPSGWSRSYESDISTSSSSNATSGIIDTESEAFASLVSSDNDKTKLTDSQNPSTPYALGLIPDSFIEENGYVEDDDDKKSNPNYKGTKVLFLGNKTSSEIGTAQYYTSSKSFTISSGDYAKISLWIKTLDVKNSFNSKTGAYISFNSSVNGVSYKSFMVDNINTNGEWAYVELYIEGSDYSSTTISSIRVGLGHGNGLNTSRYAEGFVFVDNVRYESYTTTADYVTAITDVSFSDEKSANKDAIVAISAPAADTFKSNASKEYTSLAYKARFDMVDAISVTDANEYIQADPTYNFVYGIKPIAHTGNSIGIKTFADLTDDEKDGITLAATDKVVYMIFDTPDTATFKTENIIIAAESYKLITFYTKLKISNLSSNGGVISLLEENGNTTSVISSVEALEEEGENGLWTKYRVLVKNNSDTNTTATLEFRFGVEDETVSNDANKNQDLTTGYAYLAGLKIDDIDSDIYSAIGTDSYTYKVTTNGKYSTYVDDTDETTSDSYSISIGSGHKNTMKTKPVINANGYYFNGDDTKTINGVINSAYLDNYSFLSDSYKAQIASLKDGDNKYIQPLMIYNVEATSAAYLTSTYTMSANTYNYIKVSLKGIDVKATIYLVSFEDNSYGPLSLTKDDTTKTVEKVINPTLVANDPDGDGWVDVYFYVATGEKAKSYRIEIYNGEKNSQTSQGILLINSISTGTLEESEYTVTYDNLVRDYANFNAFNTSTDWFVTNDYITFASYKDIDVPEKTEEETEETEEETEEETKDEDATYEVGKDVFLQITSIIIAVVLLAVIAVIVIRTLLKKRAKRTAKVEEYYKRDAREIALEKIAKKKAREQEKKDSIEIKEAEDTEEDYNYDEAESIEEVEAEAEKDENEIINEAVEEVEEEQSEEDKKDE